MIMKKPRIENDSVICPKGVGYWDLSVYPWGGSFRRFVSDCTAQLVRVVSTYNDGSPRDIVAKLDGKQIGVTA